MTLDKMVLEPSQRCTSLFQKCTRHKTKKNTRALTDIKPNAQHDVFPRRTPHRRMFLMHAESVDALLREGHELEVHRDARHRVVLGLDVRVPPALCVSLALPRPFREFCRIRERLCSSAQLVSM